MRQRTHLGHWHKTGKEEVDLSVSSRSPHFDISCLAQRSWRATWECSKVVIRAHGTSFETQAKTAQPSEQECVLVNQEHPYKIFATPPRFCATPPTF